MMDNSSDEKGKVIHLKEQYLEGQVMSIRATNIVPISSQSCDVQEVWLGYSDKMFRIKHVHKGELGAIEISEMDHCAAAFGREVSIRMTDSVEYDHSTYEDGELDALTFRWDDTWLHIFRMEYDLAFTRNAFDLTSDNQCPMHSGEPTLVFE